MYSDPRVKARGQTPACAKKGVRPCRASGLLWSVPFEVVHPLAKLILRLAELVLLLLKVVMRTAEEGRHILELAIEIVSILPVSNFDMHE